VYGNFEGDSAHIQNRIVFTKAADSKGPRLVQTALAAQQTGTIWSMAPYHFCNTFKKI
jgi:hypothetical protein